MESLYRGFLLAASALLVSVLASPALAVSEFSMYKCDEPSTADDDTYDYFNDNPLSTSNLDDGDCEKLCRELQKICEKNADNRVKCVKADDKFWFTLQDKLCDANYEDPEDRRSCKNSVKAQRDLCKEELRDEAEDAESDCEDRFGRESSCPGDCEDGLLDDD
jgi:hypothetical protein